MMKVVVKMTKTTEECRKCWQKELRSVEAALGIQE